MAAITEDYVSFETAKLLKEKGFPQEYDDYHALVYNEEDYEDEYEIQRMVLETRLVKAGTLSSYPLGVPEPKCYCPTHQMAMKWLREREKLAYNILIVADGDLGNLHYLYEIQEIDNELLKANGSLGDIENQRFDTYEDAVETAIKYCLEKLI